MPEPTQNEQKNKNKKDSKEGDDLSPEDLQKKEEIELMVERVQDSDVGVQRLALESLRAEVKSSSSSISSIPKALKFLRPHYAQLKQQWENTDPANKTFLADIISVLAMTMSDEGSLDSLKFRLEGSSGDIDAWGHEYVRNLAGEIIREFSARQSEEKPVDDLLGLVNQIVPFNMKHNAEPEACDLLLEVERLADVLQYVDENNFERIGLYLLGNASYATEPEDLDILKIVLEIYRKFDRLPEAFFVALRIDNPEVIQSIYDSASDDLVKKQMAFIAGRQRAFFLEEEEDEFGDLIGNMKLSDFYHALARDLSVVEVKAPKDIYKMHLIENRHLVNMKIDSAKQNLADSFVNAFVNAGFGTDSLLLEDKDRQFVWKTKDTGKMSVVASLGLIHLWNMDKGCGVLDPFIYSPEKPVSAGSLLGIGLTNCGTRNIYDPAFTLLSEHITSSDPLTRIGSILGLGLSYAGSAREDLSELLSGILTEENTGMDVLAITAYSLGLIFVGTCNPDIATYITDVLLTKTEEQLNHSYTKFLCLGLGLLYLGRQSQAVELTLETLKVIPGPYSRYAQLTVETCAHAGTGNVLEVQEMLQVCGEHLEEHNEFQAVAVLGIALISMGEEIGSNMSIRAFNHLLQYGDPVIRRTVPLALGLISISNPQLTVMDTLSKLSHDSDVDVAQGAIFALGLIGAGTNNSRIAGLLRQLSAYYCKDPEHLFTVRIAQGLLHLGKGLLTLNPYHCHGNLLSKVAIAGILGALHACFDFSVIHSEGHYLLYLFATAMQPRMLMLLNEDLEPSELTVRVGQAVDTVGQAGKPKTITGFQTHTAPVLIGNGERAELATDEYIAISSFLEGCVIVKPNPNASSKK